MVRWPGRDTRQQLVTALADALTESTYQVIGGQDVSDLRRLADAAPERVASADRRGCRCDSANVGRVATTVLASTQEKIARKTTTCRIPAAIAPKWLWKM